MATEVLIQTEDVVDFATVNGFRQDGHFCDTEIRASDGERLSAHACVVAAGSPVLRRLLLRQTKLRRSLVVRGQDVRVCGAIWRVVLQLMYTGRAFVTTARLADLLLAAETLQIDRLRSLCASLLDDIDPDVDVTELPELLNVANGKGDVGEGDSKCWTSVEASLNGTISDESEFAGQYGLAPVKQEPLSDYEETGASFEFPTAQHNGDGLFNVNNENVCPTYLHFTRVKVEPTDDEDRKPVVEGDVAIPVAGNGHVARRKGLHPQRRSSVHSESEVHNTLSPVRIWDRGGSKELTEVGQKTNQRHHCSVCGRVFRHASNLDRHRRRDVACRRMTFAAVIRRRREKRPGQFRCRTCGFAFSSRASLQKHRRTHATVTTPVTSDVPSDVYTDMVEEGQESPPRGVDQETTEADTGADMSSWLYPTKTESTVDESFASKLFTPTTKPVAPRCVVLVSDDELKLYECTICGKSFNSSKNIRRHERTHLPREVRFAKRIQNAALAAMRRMHREYHCSICGKQFPNGKNISRHKKTHHKAEVLPDPTTTPTDSGATCTCQTCGKTFPSRRNLRCHEARAHGANARTSTPKTKRKSSSHDRKSTPTEQKPPASKQTCNTTPSTSDVKPPRTYSCSVCARVFASGKNIRRHERSHRQEKRYKCETCGKHFAQSTTLVYHERIHTGEKPHVCRVCGNAYRFPTVLARHERTHNIELTAAYECPTCGRGFSRRSGLDRHRCHNKATTTTVDEKDATCGVGDATTDGDVCPEGVFIIKGIKTETAF